MLENRRFAGQQFGASVVDWLNGKPRLWRSDSPMASEPPDNTAESRWRLQKVIQGINAFVESASNGQRGKKLGQKSQQLLGELNYMLARYVTSPGFYWDQNSERGWDAGDVMRSSPGMTERGMCPSGENLAVHAAVRLAKEGLLSRVQQCLCGKWFFARFSKQRACSANCRHKRYEQTEEFKAKRREYMKNYYRKFQSPKRFERKKQLAKGKGR